MQMSAEATRPLRIFYSYAHADEAYRIQLSKSLSLLRRQGLIEEWHDREISAGSFWKGEIDARVENADIVALLVSPDFMDSDYCFGIEMKRALEREREDGAVVIPIVIRETDLTNAPFAYLQHLPKDGKAIDSWSSADAAWKDVAIGIRTAISRLKYDRAEVAQRLDLDGFLKEERVLEAAVSAEVPVMQPSEVLVEVSLSGSEGLGLSLDLDVLEAGNREESYSVIKRDIRQSRTFRIPWSREDLRKGQVVLCLRLDAPKLEWVSPEKNIRVEPFRDSGVFNFFVTPPVEGIYPITAQLLCKDISLSERLLKTVAKQRQGPPSEPITNRELVIAEVPLEFRAKSMAAGAGTGTTH